MRIQSISRAVPPYQHRGAHLRSGIHARISFGTILAAGLALLCQAATTEWISLPGELQVKDIVAGQGPEVSTGSTAIMLLSFRKFDPNDLGWRQLPAGGLQQLSRAAVAVA